MMLVRSFPLSGYGYLHLPDGTSSQAKFTLIMNEVNMTGGGGLFGEEQFIQEAAKANAVHLSIGNKTLQVALGIPNKGAVAMAVLGLATEHPQPDKPDGD